MRNTFAIAAVLLLGLASENALAVQDLNASLKRDNSISATAISYDYDGIVKLPNCSAGIVRFDDALDTDKALVLSNGHCAGFPAAGTAIGNKASTVRVTLLNSKGKSVGSVKAERLVYATMTKSDIAIYQLPISYEELTTQYAVHALTMARVRPLLNDAIEIISGYWNQGFTCAIDSFAHSSKEADWIMEDSIRFTQPGCETYGGTSGAPVLAAGTRTVVAVNNTGNQSGKKCTSNNPCEIDEEGAVTYKKGWSYAQQTYWLYGCRGGTNVDEAGFDFSLESCELLKPASAGLSL